MNASPSTDTPTIARTAPIALWRLAETFMHTLCNLFGNPQDVAMEHAFTRKAYVLMLTWLRVAEALMRRLLLIEAAAFANTPPLPGRHVREPRTRKLVTFHADKPEAWRVSFRCFTVAERRLPAGRKRKPDAGVPRFYSTWPLAERYEALIRAFNDPAPFARRLARRLHAQPHRLPDALRAPPDTRHKLDPEAFDAATAAAKAAWPAPNSS